ITPSTLAAAIRGSNANATTTTRSTVELATAAEITTGSDTTRAITPGHLRSANPFVFRIHQGNSVGLGWDGTQLLAQVDSVPMGRVLTTNWFHPDFINAAGFDSNNTILPYMRHNTNAVVHLVRNVGGSGAGQCTGLHIEDSGATLAIHTAFGLRGVPTNPSDARLKQNVTQATKRALDYVDEFKFYSFEYKADPDTHHDIGFIAQQLMQVNPRFVASVGSGKDKTYMPHDGRLLAVAMKAIQELKAEVDALRDELNTLRGSDA